MRSNDKSMKKFLKILNKTEDVVLIAMFIAMVGFIFFQVIMRFVFNNSSSWSEELGKFLFVWLSWLGISIGHRRKEHIKIGILLDRLPGRIRLIVEAVNELILIVICGITLYYGAILMGIQWDVPYAGIKISTSWGYLSLVLGCGLLVMRAFMYLLESLKSLKNYDSSLEGRYS